MDPKLVVAVDDAHAMRRVLARVLGWRGYTALVLAEVEEAFDTIVERRPAVVLLDYDLGEANGAALARRIAEALGADAPAMILVSAMADRLPPDERPLFTALHGKPFRASALLDDVDRCANRARMRSGVRAVGDRIADRRRAAKDE